MHNWFESNLGDAMLAGESLDQIKALFLAEFKKGDCPADMAVFVRHESKGHLHCEVKVYFPPTCAVVAQPMDAILCEKPSSDGLGLLVGSPDSWQALFPGNDT